VPVGRTLKFEAAAVRPMHISKKKARKTHFLSFKTMVYKSVSTADTITYVCHIG
jgi:hypothetical protein